MPKLAANLSMLFPQLEFLERFAAAAAAGRLGEAGLQLLLEPINTRSVPGFFLTGTRQTLDVLNAAGEGNAFLQYDVFHMQIMEGDLAKSIERLLARIGHIQIADVPDR